MAASNSAKKTSTSSAAKNKKSKVQQQHQQVDEKTVEKETGSLSLDELTQAYGSIREGIEAGKELSSLADEFSKFTNVDQISGLNELKLVSQLLLETHKSFPDNFDQVIDAIKFLVAHENCDVRTTTFANLKQHIVKNSESNLLDGLFKQLVLCKENIGSTTEEKLLISLLFTLMNKNPHEKMLQIIELINEYVHTDKVGALLLFLKDFEANNISILVKQSEIADALISVGEKIIGSDNVSLMPDTLDLLLKVPTINSLSMRLKLIGRFKALAKFKQPYKLTTKDDKNRLANIFIITKCVEKLFSKNAPADDFFNHLLNQVLPFFNSMKNEKKVEYIIKTLKVMASFSFNLSQISDESYLSILSLLKENMPTPPKQDTSSSETNILNENLRYTFLEPALIIFYQLSSMKPDNFTTLISENSEFVLQLHYFARCIQANIQNYSNELHAPDSQVVSENARSLLMAYSMSKNIQQLLRDLIKKTPAFNITITPTWLKKNEEIYLPLEEHKKTKEEEQEKARELEAKKEAKLEGKIYRPPIGKYSHKSDTSSKINLTAKSKRFRIK